MKSISGQLIRQRDSDGALAFFAFASTANDLLEWATIERTNEKPGAAQRLKNTAHIKTIQAFIKASGENIIPTAVTLAVKPGTYTLVFGDNWKCGLATIRIPGWFWKLGYCGVFVLVFFAVSTRKLGTFSSMITLWCTRRSIAAAVVNVSLKIWSHLLKARLLVSSTLPRS